MSAALGESGPLSFLHRFPQEARDGSPLLILLHGRGSDERDLLGLASLLPDEALVVTPRAPFPAAPWGYGPGWAWYRYVAGARVIDETLEASLGALDEFMEGLDEELPVRPGPRILGGFSQGGTTSLAWALTRPGRLAGIANFSGFLVDSSLVEPSPETAGELRVFWGHGRQDPNIPFSLGEEGRRILRRAGASIEAVDHPGGHTITADEMARFREWLAGIDGA